MAKVTVIYLSVNPSFYDVQKLAKLSFDEAKKYFEKDEIECCNVREIDVDLTKEHEMTFHADGIPFDPSDTMLNWVKVSGD